MKRLLAMTVVVVAVSAVFSAAASAAVVGPTIPFTIHFFCF